VDRRPIRARRSEQGIILLLAAVSSMVLLAVLGVAFDFGRWSIARAEAQLFADAAAHTAVRELDGTERGIEAARRSVLRLPNRWSLTRDVPQYLLEFSPDGQSWTTQPSDQAKLRYIRATIDHHSLPTPFLAPFLRAPLQLQPASIATIPAR
jgi:uncharacterized membrane protein